MSKPIILTRAQWQHLHKRLANDYSPSVMMISYKMKETLGFTVRHHREYSEQQGSMTDIRLDFYNEPKRTMFILKYSEYLEKNGKTALDIE